MADFEALQSGRRRIQDFCALHRTSVEFFRTGRSFRLHPKREDIGKGLRHITSTATCIESLLDCPDFAEITQDHARWFASKALARKRWTSEGSAQIYCRCRALPLVIKYIDAFDRRLQSHLERVLAQLRDTRDRFAVGEADVKRPQPDTWYPPNAFHTFWTLEALSRCERFGPSFARFSRRMDLDRLRNGMILWGWQTVGYQVVLHHAKSSELDTDQLAWAIAIVTRFRIDVSAFPALSTLRYRDFLTMAIAAFFQTQDRAGMWPHYEPLFHYREVGNAYCYVFETLTALLNNALRRDASLLRSLLRPYLPKLLKLVDYAESTQIRLDSTGRAIGWSSGHRTNERAAESWATAAVFQAMQALRRLAGVWTREEALKGLGQKSHDLDRNGAVQEVLRRGSTWSKDETVGEQLLTMFIQPIQFHERVNHTHLAFGEAQGIFDPDGKPIEDRQMRSAILFGPPGTSKTYLVRAVAAAIGWSYVELHASHFVAAGLPNVQRTADEIFKQLMELDHCVVLFDEIDELVRERDSEEADAFGRFLTTSMLPKLAELWKQRRIIYFVATNHVSYFDSAITRGQRFDALIMVPPPSFKAKRERLLELVRPGGLRKLAVPMSAINRELSAIEHLDAQNAAKELRHEHMLAKFVLLRWDQLEELASNLLRAPKGAETISVEALKEALSAISDGRLREYKAYLAFIEDRRRVARDYGKDAVWRVAGRLPRSIAAAPFIRGTFQEDGRRSPQDLWCVGERNTLARMAEPATTQFQTHGRVRFSGRTR